MRLELEPPILEKELVDWIQANRHKVFQELTETEDDFLANGQIFRNTPYLLFPRLLILSAKFKLAASFLAEQMLEILEKVIRLFETDQATQEFFQLSDHAKTLALMPCGYARKIRIARFDTFLDSSGTPKILEYNSDCPAGVIFTGRLMQLIRNVPTFQRFIQTHVTMEDSKIEKPDAFIDSLTSAFREFKGGAVEPNCICLLQPRNAISPEIREMSQLLRSRSYKTFIADPRDLDLVGGALRVEGEPIDLIWNKINTVNFDKLEPPDSLKPFLKACSEGLVCHVNSFPARYITESKLCLAYVSEPQFQHHFTKEENLLLRTVIPWTRKFIDSEVIYNAKKWSLHELAVEQREQFVLKAAYDIRGDGVTLGRSTPPKLWSKIIQQSLGGPYVLQEYVPASELMVLKEPDASWSKMKFSLDMFMLDSKLQGFGSKISEGHKLNLFQGGSKMPVFAAN